ncbi:uncharacterized protein LOC141927693 [Strix aluco]|uniref:uncharacterized protein LOC141927693 n=1 Tax=Strix aluco TaxID=111821 RepID=UPI003DA1F145
MCTAYGKKKSGQGPQLALTPRPARAQGAGHSLSVRAHRATSGSQAGGALLGPLSPRCPVLTQQLGPGAEGPRVGGAAARRGQSQRRAVPAARARQPEGVNFPAGRGDMAAPSAVHQDGGTRCHTRRWRRPALSRQHRGNCVGRPQPLPSVREGDRNQKPAAVTVLRPGWQGLYQQTAAWGSGWQQPQPRARTSGEMWVRTGPGLGDSPGNGVESSPGGRPLPRPPAAVGAGRAECGLFAALGPGTTPQRQLLWSLDRAKHHHSPFPRSVFHFALNQSPPCRCGAAWARSDGNARQAAYGNH